MSPKFNPNFIFISFYVITLVAIMISNKFVKRHIFCKELANYSEVKLIYIAFFYQRACFIYFSLVGKIVLE